MWFRAGGIYGGGGGGKLRPHHKENNLEVFLSHVANSVKWYNHLKITSILVQVLGCTNHIHRTFPGGMRKYGSCIGALLTSST